MVRYVGPASKAEAAARMYLLAGRPVEPLGPGSKEKKSALVALGAAVGLDLVDVPGKTECGRLIAQHVGAEWGSDCHSAGDTITGRGMARLVDSAVAWLIKQPGRLPRKTLQDILDRAHEAALAPSKETSAMPLATSELEQNVAEQLSILTIPGPTPEGVRPSASRVELSQERFEDGAWRAVVVEVQGWLHLGSEIAGETPEEFDAALGSALAGDGPSSDRGALLERLAKRLERAVTLRERFQESVEGTAEGRATLATATQEWIDAWEEAEEEEEAEVGGPIKADADVWRIMDFVQHAEDRELELSPPYQRADVWPTGDAQILIESVVRGIPLPSIILLQQNNGGVRYDVVDGKQRLTSILRFMGRHPRAVEIVRAKAEQWGEPGLLETFQGDYPAFKKLWKQHEQTRLTAQVERDNYFPFPLRSGEVKPLSGPLAGLRGRYYCEIRDHLVDVRGNQRRVRSIFEQAGDYKVPVILYEEVTGEQIHEVFSLYNKQGKHLNAEEIRNALFHHLALMRGLLVTAGDASNVAEVAPFLKSDWDDLSSTWRTLDTYGFGRAGYKRTKLLSWVASVLFAEAGTVGGRSTAGAVNALLRRVDENKRDALRSEPVVADAMLLLDHGLDAHATVPGETWAQKFKNPQSKNGWQELPLVSVLIALSAAQAVLDDRLVDRLEAVCEDLQTATEKRWVRPEKTQTAEQWRFTAGVVSEMLQILGVDPAEAQSNIAARFGNCGLSSLLALGKPKHWTA